MTHNPKYKPTDRMVSLISDNYQLIQVMSRFGIPLGFGDKTVTEVCSDNGVDCRTFLTVVNFMIDGFSNFDSTPEVSVEALMHYLRQKPYLFPRILSSCHQKKTARRHTIANIGCFISNCKTFDEYIKEVTIHMEHEEHTVFEYVKALLNGEKTDSFKIATYSDHHEQVGYKLKELKNIIIKYCPQDADTNLLNAALYDIYRCEDELTSHCLVEDCLLVPAIVRLERESTTANRDC